MGTPFYKKKTLAAAASGLAVALSPLSIAQAQCNDFSNDINALHQVMSIACDVNEQYGEEDNWFASGCQAWSDLDAAGIPTSGVDVWNALANNGSLTIGARVLFDGIRADGDLYQGTKKTFIIDDIIDDNFQFDINHENGRADLEVSICHISDDGSKQIIANYFDENRSGIDRTVTVNESGMYAILLKSRSTGAGVQHYKYNITVDVDNQPAPPTQPKFPKLKPGKIAKQPKKNTSFPAKN